MIPGLGRYNPAEEAANRGIFGGAGPTTASAAGIFAAGRGIASRIPGILRGLGGGGARTGARGGVRGLAGGARNFLGTPTGRAAAGAASTTLGIIGADALLNNISTNGEEMSLLDLLAASGGKGGKLNTLPVEGWITDAIPYEGPDGRVIYRAPRGYVVIRKTDVAVWRPVAISLGIWKPRKKPLISVRDTNAIRRASSAQKKIMNAARRSGLNCTYKGGRRK